MAERNLEDSQRLALESQLRLVAAAHPDVVVTGPDGYAPRLEGELVGHLHREGRLLLRRGVAEEVGRFLVDRGHGVEVSQRHLTLQDHGNQPVPALLQGHEPGRGVQEICARVFEEFGDDAEHPAASPHHMFFYAPRAWLCPASEPQPVPHGTHVDPPEGPRGAGEGVRVAVLDTGFLPGANAHSWLHGVSDVDEDYLDLFDVADSKDGADGFIDPYAGHGTFIAGVVRRVAPAAQMYVRRLDVDLDEMTDPTFSADVIDEMKVGQHLRQAIRDGQQVVSLSAGGRTQNHHAPLSLYGLKALFEAHDAVLVAAAGNEDDDRPFYPAHLPWVTGVGALNAAKTGRASYSNFGRNADVYAPGTDLVNAYAAGIYAYFQYPDEGRTADFDGLAQWSGTSFAAPIVAGLIAARMSAHNEAAPDARDALMRIARTHHRLAGVGATLDPGYGDLGI